MNPFVGAGLANAASGGFSEYLQGKVQQQDIVSKAKQQSFENDLQTQDRDYRKSQAIKDQLKLEGEQGDTLSQQAYQLMISAHEHRRDPTLRANIMTIYKQTQARAKQYGRILPDLPETDDSPPTPEEQMAAMKDLGGIAAGGGSPAGINQAGAALAPMFNPNTPQPAQPGAPQPMPGQPAGSALIPNQPVGPVQVQPMPNQPVLPQPGQPGGLGMSPLLTGLLNGGAQSLNAPAAPNATGQPPSMNPTAAVVAPQQPTAPQPVQQDYFGPSAKVTEDREYRFANRQSTTIRTLIGNIKPGREPDVLKDLWAAKNDNEFDQAMQKHAGDFAGTTQHQAVTEGQGAARNTETVREHNLMHEDRTAARVQADQHFTISSDLAKQRIRISKDGQVIRQGMDEAKLNEGILKTVTKWQDEVDTIDQQLGSTPHINAGDTIPAPTTSDPSATRKATAADAAKRDAQRNKAMQRQGDLKTAIVKMRTQVHSGGAQGQGGEAVDTGKRMPKGFDFRATALKNRAKGRDAIIHDMIEVGWSKDGATKRMDEWGIK
jgi:hypothetical protein